MPNTKISNLTSAGALSGTEVLPIVQSGSTVKTTTQDIANLVPPSNPNYYYNALCSWSFPGQAITTVYADTIPGSVLVNVGMTQLEISSPSFNGSESIVVYPTILNTPTPSTEVAFPMLSFFFGMTNTYYFNYFNIIGNAIVVSQCQTAQPFLVTIIK